MLVRFTGKYVTLLLDFNSVKKKSPVLNCVLYRVFFLAMEM